MHHDLSSLFPHASPGFLRLNCDLGKVPCPKLEPAAGDGALAAPPVEEGNGGRVFVRITSYRRRLLDEDNLAGKGFCDLCRYAGILRGDSPTEARIENRQVKVASKEEEGTLIELFPIP